MAALNRGRDSDEYDDDDRRHFDDDESDDEFRKKSSEEEEKRAKSEEEDDQSEETTEPPKRKILKAEVNDVGSMDYEGENVMEGKDEKVLYVNIAGGD